MFVALNCGRRVRRARNWSSLVRCRSIYVRCLCEARRVDADYVEGRGNPHRIRNLGRARLAATHHTNPEMSERFCEMRMMWFSAGVIRSSMTVEEGEALAHEASTPK